MKGNVAPTGNLRTLAGGLEWGGLLERVPLCRSASGKEGEGMASTAGREERTGDKVVVGNVGVLGKGMKVRMAGEGRQRPGR